MWCHFDKFMDIDGSLKAKCNYYGKEYRFNSSTNGTFTLNAYRKVCKKFPLSGESKLVYKKTVIERFR